MILGAFESNPVCIDQSLLIGAFGAHEKTPSRLSEKVHQVFVKCFILLGHYSLPWPHVH